VAALARADRRGGSHRFGIDIFGRVLAARRVEQSGRTDRPRDFARYRLARRRTDPDAKAARKLLGPVVSGRHPVRPVFPLIERPRAAAEVRTEGRVPPRQATRANFRPDEFRGVSNALDQSAVSGNIRTKNVGVGVPRNRIDDPTRRALSALSGLSRRATGPRGLRAGEHPPDPRRRARGMSPAGGVTFMLNPLR